MTLEQLRAFVAIADTGSLSGAADKIRRTQPAVSVSLKELELELGTILVERRRAGALLTHEGQEFLQHVRQALAILDSARQKVAGGGTAPVRIVIATTDTLATYRLPAVIARFSKRFPKVSVLIHSKQSRAAAEMVAGGVADVGFLPFEAISGGLNAIEIGRTRELFVQSSQGTLFRGRKMISVQQLSAMPLIMLSADTMTRQVLEKIFGQAGASIQTATEAISIEVIKAIVKSGLGCSLLPDIAVEEERKAGLLLATTVKEIAPRPWGGCVRKSAARNDPVDALLEISRHAGR